MFIINGWWVRKGSYFRTLISRFIIPLIVFFFFFPSLFFSFLIYRYIGTICFWKSLISQNGFLIFFKSNKNNIMKLINVLLKLYFKFQSLFKRACIRNHVLWFNWKDFWDIIQIVPKAMSGPNNKSKVALKNLYQTHIWY